MRFLFRLFALIALSVAVIMAVVDATRTIAADAWTFTPLGDSWRAASPDSFAAVQEFLERHALPVLWDPGMVFILSLPGWVVFAVLALGLYALGRRGRGGEAFAVTL